MNKRQQKANKVLKTTTTFLIGKGTEVLVTDLGFTPFLAVLPDNIRVKVTDYFKVTKCGCCSNRSLTYRDDLDRYNTVLLREVIQVAESKFKEAA